MVTLTAADELLVMDGADEAFGAAVTAVLITLLVCAVLAVAIPTVATIFAARAKRPHLWLVFLLAFVGVLALEILAIVTYLAVTDR